MRSAGLQDVNPSHPKLLALLTAGITQDELVSAAADAVGKGKSNGFAYALATAEGRRRDAATTPLPARATGRSAPKSADRLPAWRVDEIRRQFEATPTLVPAELLPHIGVDPATRRPFARPAHGLTIIDTTAKEIGYEPASRMG